MRLFKLCLVGILAGTAAISLASTAQARGPAVAGSHASLRGGVVAVVGGGHLHNSRLVGQPTHRSQPRPWWDAHGGPANPAGSYLGYVNGRPNRSTGWNIWLGNPGGHGDHGDHGGDDGDHGHHHGDHHGDFGYGDDVFYGGYYGYDEDGDAYVDTIPLPDQFGFFATGGQVIQHDGKQPVYAYDRGYPYEWYGGRTHAAAAPPPPPMPMPMPGMAPMGAMGPGMAPGIHCEVQSTVDEGTSRQAEVRVCRGW